MRPYVYPQYVLFTSGSHCIFTHKYPLLAARATLSWTRSCLGSWSHASRRPRVGLAHLGRRLLASLEAAVPDELDHGLVACLFTKLRQFGEEPPRASGIVAPRPPSCRGARDVSIPLQKSPSLAGWPRAGRRLAPALAWICIGFWLWYSVCSLVPRPPNYPSINLRYPLPRSIMHIMEVHWVGV